MRLFINTITYYRKILWKRKSMLKKELNISLIKIEMYLKRQTTRRNLRLF